MPSFIVPARNNGEFTSKCLGSILFSLSRLQLTNCEFVLVDDASAPEDRVADAFRRHRADARGHETKILRSNKHQHYSGVFSLGLHHATRDLVFFISNDMLVTPSFLQALMLVSSLSADFGIVRGTSNYTDSHPEHTVEPAELPRHFGEVEIFSRNVFATHGCKYVEDQVLSGDAVLIKRAVIDRIGVLDMRFFGFFGDIDYGMRAHLAGFKLVCAKGAWLFHEGSGHIKGRSDATYDELHRRRMELVSAAFQEFRGKWQLETPAFGDLRSVHFFDHARERAHMVPMHCPLPEDAMNDVEQL